MCHVVAPGISWVLLIHMAQTREKKHVTNSETNKQNKTQFNMNKNKMLLELRNPQYKTGNEKSVEWRSNNSERNSKLKLIILQQVII